MPKQPRIALTGYSGSGKTTLAKQSLFKRYSFGTEVKRAVGYSMLAYMRDIPELDRLDAVEFVESHKAAFRVILQEFGHQARQIDPLIWIRPVLEQIRITNPDVPLIVDDVRYLNEADELRKVGFTIIRINGTYVPLPLNQQTHPSEVEMPLIDPDYVIYPDRDETALQQLRRIVDERYHEEIAPD